MADPNPLDGKAPIGLNEWGYLEVPKNNAIFQSIEDIHKSTNDVFEVVSLGLDLISTVLDFVASLLVDITNPLKPLVDAILVILEAFAADLRKLGLYITYDKVTKANFTELLKGGYQGYEERLLKKLLDKKDKTRPDFTSGTKVLAFQAFGGSGDVSQFIKIYEAFKKFFKVFLGEEPESASPSTPSQINYSYYKNILGGAFEVLPSEVSSNAFPDGFRLKLKFSAPPAPNPSLKRTIIMPQYVLVCVSRKPEGEVLAKVDVKTRPIIKSSQPTTINLVSALPYPAHLYPLFLNNSCPNVTSGKVENGELVGVDFGLRQTPIMVQAPNGDVRIDDSGKLKKDYSALLVKLYEAGDQGLTLTSANTEIQIDLPFGLLNKGGDQADELFFTCYGVSEEGAKSITSQATEYGKVREVLSSDLFLNERGDIRTPTTISRASRTAQSKLPTALKTSYLEAMKEFLTIFYLSGAWRGEVALQIIYDSSDYPQSLLKFREDRLTDVVNREDFAKAILRKVDLEIQKLSPSSERALKEFKSQIERYKSKFSWSFYDILKATAEGGEGVFNEELVNGVSYEGIFSDARNIRDLFYTWERQQALSGLPSTPKHVFGLGETQPYIRWGGAPVHDVIGAIPGVSDQLTLGVQLWNLSRKEGAKEQGEWIALRPFYDSDFSTFVDFVDTLKVYLETFSKALEGVVSQILNYINLVKGRIAELQAIIGKLKALIDFIFNSLRLPLGLYATYHIADGIEGLASSVLQSTQKPEIPSNGYGVGGMVVIGGAPTIIYELFIAMLGSDKEEGQ
jgi:hypothetical protein